MEVILKTENGRLVHGDNIEAMKKIKENSVDSCISDFPYAIEFMGKNWDSAKHWHDGEGSHSEFKGTGYDGKRRPDFYKNSKEDKILFYDWCFERAIELHRIIKPGGYVCIFGHPKTNHRMKSAFEDAGFQIVEEIDWIYGTGFPKNQDIGKLFDKKAGKEREIIGTRTSAYGDSELSETEDGRNLWCKQSTKIVNLTGEPISNKAKKWDGWKTAGLKPAHEPITVFQKPLEGTYIQNIEKHNVGGMNIDACRVPTNDKLVRPSIERNDNLVFGKGLGCGTQIEPEGRFPANMIFDTYMGEELDNQSGISKSTGGKGEKSKGALGNSVYGKYENKELATNAGGLGDEGGASRYFLKIEAEDFVPFLYCPKPTKKRKR